MCGPTNEISRRSLLKGSVGVGAGLLLGSQGLWLPATASAAVSNPGIIGCDGWGAQAARGTISLTSRPTTIVIHHTDTANTNDFSQAQAFQLARNIQQWHFDQRPEPWIDSGQQLTISRGGYVMEGRHRSLEVLQGGTQHVIGSHTYEHNHYTIGIENEGNYTTASPTPTQWAKLVDTCAYICQQYGIPATEIRGHRDFVATACPGNMLYSLLPNLRADVAAKLGSGSARRFDVVSRGPDGGLWIKTLNGNTWAGWNTLGSPSGLTIKHNPTVVWHGANSLSVYAVASDNYLWTRDGNASNVWGGWWQLGGPFPGGVDATVRPGGRIDLVARGYQGQLFTRTWNGQAWSGWDDRGKPAGMTLTSDPTAVWNSTGALHVFARASNNELWAIGSNGTTWGSWYSLGGSFPGGADAATRRSDGRIDLFARGWEGHMWTRSWNGSSWGAGWSDIGGWFSGDVGAVWTDSTHLEIFGLGGDNQVWRNSGNGSSWSGWTGMSGPLAGGPDAASPYAI